VLALALGTAHYFHYAKKKDPASQVANYFNEKLNPGETFFGINGWQISYHLTNRPVPTSYVHSSLLYLDHHVKAFQVDELGEAERLISTPELMYLVGRRKDANADTPLTDRLMEAFEPHDEIGDDILVWKRK
jgi:hypothetical protein